MVADRQLDPSILLRLARNKQTHRAILEQIAGRTQLQIELKQQGEAWAPGRSRPKSEGPITTPAIISPTTWGW